MSLEFGVLMQAAFIWYIGRQIKFSKLRMPYFVRLEGGASEEVIIQIIRTKCMPVLLYGLEACPLRKSDIWDQPTAY